MKLIPLVSGNVRCAGNIGSERCDAIARAFAMANPNPLQQSSLTTISNESTGKITIYLAAEISQFKQQPYDGSKRQNSRIPRMQP